MSHRRRAHHPVPKEPRLPSPPPARNDAAAAAAAAGHELHPDITYTQQELSGTYAFNKAKHALKPPGPATYSPSRRYTNSAAPRATIGREERFSTTFAGIFVRAEGGAPELQCRDSPGPAYVPGSSTFPRAPTVSWGHKRHAEQVSRFRGAGHMLGEGATHEVGPAAYHPKMDQTKPRATGIQFARSSRFDSFGGHAFGLNNSPYDTGAAAGESHGLPNPKLDYVRPRTSAFSFGGGRAGPPRGDEMHTLRPRPRTAFLTHSIRGGLAKPATLECGVGAADYDTEQNSIGRNVKQPARNKFGSAPRFARPGLMFVSAEHAKADGNFFSPGPKYNSDVGTVALMATRPRPQAASLHWSP